jgi:NTE family protein
VILNAFSIFHDRVARARLMGDPPDLLISPDVAGIGVFEFHRAEELIAIGEAAAQPHLAAFERYLRARLRRTKELPSRQALAAGSV